VISSLQVLKAINARTVMLCVNLVTAVIQLLCWLYVPLHQKLLRAWSSSAKPRKPPTSCENCLLVSIRTQSGINNTWCSESSELRGQLLIIIQVTRLVRGSTCICSACSHKELQVKSSCP